MAWSTVDRDGERSAHPHALDVRELVEAELRELTPVARLLHATERETGIALHHPVDEAGARLQLCREAIREVAVLGEDRRAESVLGGVGDRKGIVRVLGDDDARDGPERFLLERR